MHIVRLIDANIRKPVSKLKEKWEVGGGGGGLGRFLWIFLLIHLEGGFIWTWNPPRFFIGKLDVRLFKSKRLISQLNTLLVILLSNLYLFRHFLDLKSTVAFASMYTYINRLFNFSKPSDVQGGGGGERRDATPHEIF